MSEKLYLSLDSKKLAEKISNAQKSVCYAAPGILPKVAKALVEVSERIKPESITVCLDLNEEVFRMGYGDIEAVETLQNSKIKLNSSSGLRAGIIIIDNFGYMFTPTALLLEADELSDAPNAMRLLESQVTEVRIRISEKEREIVAQMAETEKERERIRQQDVEVESKETQESEIRDIKENLKKNPPTKFNLQRQVRVFSAKLQYVEISFSGVRIQRRRIPIPQGLFTENATDELNDKLRTTFDLIKNNEEFSTNHLVKKLNNTKKNFTCFLDKTSRVILKEKKLEFDNEISEIEKELTEYKKDLVQKLDNEFEKSKQQILEHCVPILQKNPPKKLTYSMPNQYGKEEIRQWVEREVFKMFPKADELCQKMKLEVVYKDITFETLNDKDFISKIKKRFPYHDWDKLYDDYLAAKEKEDSKSRKI